jgi:HSP20 family molecular chaperone IbpA
MTASSDTRNQVKENAEITGERTPVLRPAVDIYENGHAITLNANLPGVSEERLALEVDGETLTIQGDILVAMPQSMESLHADIRSTRYQRAFTLSNELDTGSISAALKDGVLTVSIPKREEVRPRKIEINID